MGDELILNRRSFPPKTDLGELRSNYDYDLSRFFKYSSTVNLNSDITALKAFCVEIEHAIEKGLSFETPRPAFGVKKINAVILAVRELESTGHADEATLAARGCLQQYVDMHESRGWDLPPELGSSLKVFLEERQAKNAGGTKILTRGEINRATDFDYERFISARHSVRHFTGEPVSREAAEEAVRLAIKSPRPENRESRHVYAALDPITRTRLMSYHHGHAGFDKKLGAVFVITVDLQHYDRVGERNQGWIDGGLFAMSLCYALHSQRLGTCMLNWSEPCDQDRRLRQAFTIPDNEIVITFLGAGHLPPQINVAYSMPPSVDSVFSEIEERR